MLKSIVQHELKYIYFDRRSWFCIAGMQLLLGIIYNWLINKYLINQSLLSTANRGITEEVIHPYYAWFTLLLLIFIPIISTQTICAEKCNRTWVNYQCAPVSTLRVVAAKFMALNICLIMAMLLISLLPLSIMLSGSLDWGQFFSSVLGAYLMLSAALAIGIGFASFMRNITRSNLVVFLGLLGFILLEWAAQFSGKHATILQNYGLLSPLKNFLCGTLIVQNIAYYILLIYAFLLLASWRLSRGDQHA